jgi:hypothetical protein
MRKDEDYRCTGSACGAAGRLKILRETFEEQLASDPVDRAQGQMMMF